MIMWWVAESLELFKLSKNLIIDNIQNQGIYDVKSHMSPRQINY